MCTTIMSSITLIRHISSVYVAFNLSHRMVIENRRGKHSVRCQAECACHATHQNQVLPICCPTLLPNMAPTIPSPVPLSIASLTSSSPASSAIP